MSKVYIMVGVPASGKSWVASQLRDTVSYVAHDDYIKGGYIETIIDNYYNNGNVICETPFSISKFTEAFDSKRIPYELVFIIESEDTLRQRYLERTGKQYQNNNLSRQQTYIQRALESKSFTGNSTEVLNYIKNKLNGSN